MPQLLREGGKLAVLGVDDSFGGNRRWWHIVRAGSYSAPQVGAPGHKITHGTPLCAVAGGPKYVATNGYPPDFKPPIGSLCPRCAERN